MSWKWSSHLQDKLEAEIKTKSEAFAAEETKITKETETMKKRIEKKQKSLDIWNEVGCQELGSRIGVEENA